jgi:hypothetical protein
MDAVSSCLLTLIIMSLILLSSSALISPADTAYNIGGNEDKWELSVSGAFDVSVRYSISTVIVLIDFLIKNSFVIKTLTSVSHLHDQKPEIYLMICAIIIKANILVILLRRHG